MARCKWFTDQETQGMTDEFCLRIDRARELYGSPIVWICGLRAPEHNTLVGGMPNSPHLTGEAFDVMAPRDPFIRERLAWSFGRAGFTNVESAPNHFHVSCSKNVPQDAYYQGTDH